MPTTEAEAEAEEREGVPAVPAPWKTAVLPPCRDLVGGDAAEEPLVL
eukprot:CAMPEP_0194342950 /NCGR_PEP_ID=MMETSP0171-20130528/94497_1 /TAXON_ID=218684 /ORGANISM="Corethron pennatum, Strain L29A3" /LENGTH=46 /DNA_ID= /DNA_START= /DNA_END= /DNA_ORIENTATION=